MDPAQDRGWEQADWRVTCWARAARLASPYLLVALLGGAGALHLLRPESFDTLIPPFLPHARAWTYGSGVVEVACAVAVALPRSRRAGGLAAAVLLGAARAVGAAGG